jgi:hypothetical protein
MQDDEYANGPERVWMLCFTQREKENGSKE